MSERAPDSDDARIGEKVTTLARTFASSLADGPPASESGRGPKRSV
ncbi:hypothetical protein [Halospeciosus flavus]|uniref:Uncharacterized protein n=1 Tax=Halospeciosus flavus TaxID=3032283 RepID=A0ABD5Z870_9EURY